MKTGTNKSRCHICNDWTPEKGCDHYLPDAKKEEEKESRRLKTYIEKLADKKELINMLLDTIDNYPATVSDLVNNYLNHPNESK